MVVYHLPINGQTSRFTVWENGKQNSRLLNFVLESHSTICTNQFHLWKNRCESLKYQSWLWRIERKFLFETFLLGKHDNLFRCYITPGNSPPRQPVKSCFIQFPTGFSKNFSLQSNQVKRTPQETINEFIIQKLNPLLVVDFRLISAFLHV